MSTISRHSGHVWLNHSLLTIGRSGNVIKETWYKFEKMAFLRQSLGSCEDCLSPSRDTNNTRIQHVDWSRYTLFAIHAHKTVTLDPNDETKREGDSVQCQKEI